MGDVRGEIAEADDPRNIGPADTFPLGKHVAADECRVEPARLEEQLDQSRVRFRRGKRKFRRSGKVSL